MAIHTDVGPTRARLRAAPSAWPSKWPVTHRPLACARRKPGYGVVDVASIASVMRAGVSRSGVSQPAVHAKAPPMDATIAAIAT